MSQPQPAEFDLFASVFTTPILGTVRSENCASPLTVVQRAFDDPDVDVANLAETPADEVYLSADARGFVVEWHRGPESGQSTYVEIRRRRAHSFHGWVDAESRRIVQAG